MNNDLQKAREDLKILSEKFRNSAEKLMANTAKASATVQDLWDDTVYAEGLKCNATLNDVAVASECIMEELRTLQSRVDYLEDHGSKDINETLVRLFDKIEERLAALEAGQDTPKVTLPPLPKLADLECDHGNKLQWITGASPLATNYKHMHDRLVLEVEKLRKTLAMLQTRVEGLDLDNLDMMLGKRWVLEGGAA